MLKSPRGSVRLERHSVSITIAPKGKGWTARIEDESAFGKAYNGVENVAYGARRDKEWVNLGKKIRHNGKVTGKEIS